MARASIVLCNDLQELQRLGAFIGGLPEAFGMDRRTLYQVNLACDELVTNTILYGYAEEEEGKRSIHIDVALAADGWELRIADDGRPFNPLLKPGPDIGLGIDERGIGGLGIHFVRQVMDDIRYERTDECNVLVMKKLRRTPD